MSISPGALLLAALLWVPGLASAQQVGRALEVSQPASITTPAGTARLGAGAAVADGDVIVTGAAGRVQLEFADKTRIAIGPNARLKIENILFRKNNTARKFAISAASGTMRFITGESPKNAYSVRTPSTTMGVRGTIFDVAVQSPDLTRLVVFDGDVRFCGRGEACATVRGGCQTVTYSLADGYSQPQTVEEKQQFLRGNFPLVANQRPLRSTYVVRTEACGQNDRVALPDRRIERGGDRGEGGGNPAE